MFCLIFFAKASCSGMVYDGENIPRKARMALRAIFFPEYTNQQHEVEAGKYKHTTAILIILISEIRTHSL